MAAPIGVPTRAKSRAGTQAGNSLWNVIISDYVGRVLHREMTAL
jgi:hypothetical protein